MTLYMVMVAIFALLLMWTESPQNPCIQNYPYGEAFSEQFSAAFTLSWTTFSTVVSNPERDLLNSTIGFYSQWFTHFIHFSSVDRAMGK